jgi:hypothetical protein
MISKLTIKLILTPKGINKNSRKHLKDGETINNKTSIIVLIL